jgi:predicted ATPase
VQQAGYALIDAQQKQAVHLRIGRLLLAHISPEERSEKLFTLVEHLNQGRDLITDPQEQVQLAELNLAAGEKAKDATTYAAAREYLATGMEILPENSWPDHYDLTLSLYRERTEVEYLNGDFEKSQRLIYLTLANVHSPLEKAEIYTLILFQFTLKSQYKEAIETGRKALKELGTDLPESDLAAALEVELAKAKDNLGQRKIASLINAPEITIPEKRLSIKLLSNTDPPAYFSNQELYAVIVAKMAQMSLKYGHVPETAKAYVTYGIILGSVLGDYQSGYEFGQLAVKLSDRFQNPAQKCSACLVLGGHLNHWVKHIKWAEELFNQSYQAGLESGELRHFGYAIEHQLRYLFYQGKNLEYLREILPKFLHFNEKIQNQWAVDGILGFKLTLLNLTGMTDSKLQFHDRELSDRQYLQNCRQHNSFAWLCTFNIFKSQVLYLYGEYQEALKCVREAKKWLKFVLGHFQGSEQNFHESLILTACYPLVGAKTQKKYWH